jgi:bifunctional DNase/RNase
MIGLAGLLLVSFVLFSLSKETPPDFIQMEVKGVQVDMTGQNPVVILIDKEAKKALPIWIGYLEANAIDRELRNLTPPRPMTHDLLFSILAQADVKVKEVKVVELREHTYYAKLTLTFKKDVLELDARPSDAIVLALKSKTPIFVAAKILDEQGILLTREESLGERYGIRIQELTSALASHFNFKGQKGVLVAEVIPGSPSEASGIKAGDIITKVNVKEVGSVQEFKEIVDAAKGGSSLEILLFRDDKFQKKTLKLTP